MAAFEPDDLADRGGESSGVGLARLSEARWLLAAMAAFLAILALFGAIGGWTALAVLAAVVVAVLLVPRGRVDDRLAARAEPLPAAWPETGIKLFADALPDPCFILDRRGILRYANARASDAFRVKPGEPLSYWLRSPDLNAAFDRVAKGGPPERVEFVDRVPTERWFAAWFSPLGPVPADGQPNFVVLILDDLSEGRRIERVRVDFVANASHELRTPLASLAGFIETLQGPAKDDPEARGRFLRIMHEQATRMSRLINDLLSLSRVELKAHVRPSEQVDLTALIDHVADALEPLARELGVAIETRLPSSPVIVRGERDELIQVFENLIENACKYGQSGKRVVVTLREPAPGAGPAVSVRDFGPGIAAEHLPRLTERFYRVDVEASRQHRGTGLGLAIAKHILARHEARLSVESTPGEGAEFMVVFPQGGDSKGSAEKQNIEAIQQDGAS
jgi:two-component system phosphate regulon sensor histidine kinase PhoR